MKYHSRVIRGQGRGKDLGFPTLNLTIPPDFKAPHGVFAGWVWIDTQRYPGAFHFGPVPVFNQTQNSLEVFVLDQALEHPPQKIQFELIQKLRSVKNFNSPTSLSAQIKADVTQTRKILKPLQ